MNANVIDPKLSEIDDEQARLRTWQALTSSLFVASRAKPAVARPNLVFRCFNLERALFFDHCTCAYDAERNLAQIVTQGVDHILIGLQISGMMQLTRPGSGTGVIRPGDVFVLDLAQSIKLATDGTSAVQICIPRRRFDDQTRRSGLRHMQILPSQSSPLFKLLADHLLNMRGCLSRAGSEQRNLLTSAALAICNAAFMPGYAAPSSLPVATAIEIKQFIEDNIQNSDLGIDLVRARFGLSRTPLYKLFENDGGIASYIRNRRLVRAMRLLAGVEGGPRQRVSSVAYACGYESEKVFSRAFRRRYGVNPRDVTRGGGGGPVQERSILLTSWIHDL
ncbi:helix-turn-helix domain-containing protein [Rhodoplanes elegans]|nr:AraC family transcriptional regulator [Rhodoplanes elegans]